MKKRLVKLCGVGLALILLASLLVIALPASAATLAWSTQAIPSPLTFQIFTAATLGVDASFVKVAPNGDILAVDTNPAAADVVYRSIDGGVTWIPSVAIPANIVDLEISPSYATDGTVIVAGNTVAPLAQVYISTNWGATFAVLGGTGGAGLLATSVAVSPNYNAGVGEIALGLADPLAGVAALPDVLIWGRGGVQNWASYDAVFAGTEDVTDVMYSPNFPIDATLICVASTAARTAVHTLVTGAAWDATIGAAVAIATPTGAILDVGGVGTGIVTAELAIPSDFNGSQPLARTVYVAARSGQPDDRLYRLAVGSAVGPTLIQPSTLVADATFSSLAFVGMGATGSLIAGAAANTQVYVSTNPASVFIAFTAAWAPPTGATVGGECTYVYPANDYATSSRIYAGTTGLNSGVSISDNNGANFYQSGLIDTFIVAPAGINDIQAVSATEIFMLTNDGAGGADSLWKSTDGGAVWYRVYSAVLAGNTGIVRPSPNYATDMTVYLADINAAVVAGNIQISVDGGATWAGRSCPIGPGDVAVRDQYTIYVGGAAATNVQSTTTGGWTWQVAATPIVAGGAVNQIKVDTATGHLLVASAANVVYLSTNGNISYVPVAGGLAIGAGGNVGAGIVEFDTNYATNSTIYAADNGAAGVWRATIGISTNWGVFAIDGGINLLPQDIFSDPCGALYATDITASTPIAGGMLRILDPLVPVPALVELVTGGDLLVVGDTLTVMTKGGDVIWAVARNVSLVRTFTDTLCTATPTGITPAVGSVVDNTQASVTFTFSAVPGAWNYTMRYDTRADFLSAVPVNSAILFDPTVVVIAAAPLPPLAVAGLPVNGQTVYWQVRVRWPVFGPWSSTYTFNTELVAAVVNSPVILGPFEGGTNYGGWDADVNPAFQWGSIAGATGYEFKLGTDAALTNLLVDLTGANALGVVNAYKLTAAVYTLDYNTTYYWTVRAIGAGTNNTWAPTVAFTTVGVAGSGAATPPTAAPPVVITQVPAPTITIPPAPQATQVTFQPPATEEISPAYIWVIIVIGAVLVIAVIILIVRTRRSV